MVCVASLLQKFKEHSLCTFAASPFLLLLLQAELERSLFSITQVL